MKLGLSRLLLVLVAGALAIMIGLNVWTRGHGGGARIGGQDAPFRPDLIARIDSLTIAADLIGTGEVRAVEFHGGFYYLLQRDQWLRARSGAVEGPFGVGSVGGPGALQAAADLVATDTAVFVLDGRARAVLVYDPTGVYRRAIRLGPGLRFARPEQLLQDGSGRLYITAQALLVDSTVWEIRQLTDGEPVVLRMDGADLSSPFDELRTAVMAGDTILVVSTQGYAARLVHDGRVARIWQRADPPLYSVPDTIRRSYATRISGLDPRMRERIALPAAVPPVRGIGVLPGSKTVVALSRAFGSVDVEVVDRDGQPVGRVSGRPWPNPVFFPPQRATYLHHEPDRLVVISHVFH